MQGRTSSWCSGAMGDRHAARISVAEMKCYYIYSEWCSWLLSVADGESPGPQATSWGHSQGCGLRWLWLDVGALPPADRRPSW